MVPSPRYDGQRADNSGLRLSSRSQNNAQDFLSPAKATKGAKQNKHNTDMKKVHVASINIKAGGKRDANMRSSQDPHDGGEAFGNTT